MMDINVIIGRLLHCYSASLLPGMHLVSLLISLYLFAAPAKSGAGISLLINLSDDINLLLKVANMMTVSRSSDFLLTLPFNYATDFTELADNCERFVEVLVESDDPAEKFALCGRLSSCLSILKQTLYEPVPEHLRDYLTIDSWPSHLPEFNPESDTLCRYCEELTLLTMQNTLTAPQRRVFEDLLFELVGYFSDRLKAPRWMRTAEGLVEIGG